MLTLKIYVNAYASTPCILNKKLDILEVLGINCIQHLFSFQCKGR